MTAHTKDAARAPQAGDRTLEGTADPGARLFLDFLSSIRPEIEAALERRWRDKVSDVERYGREVAAMAMEARSLTLRGGKRFRAGLLVAAYQGVAPDAPLAPAIDAGVALELLQTYLLIQDDWIDGDAVRRGGRTVHVGLTEVLGDAHLGASSAILAGDLTWGFALSTLAAAAAPPDRTLAAVRRFCKMHEDVVIGQHLDVVGRAEDVEQMHALKTGSYTVRGPLALGATLAGAPAETVAALERFAEPVGVAFQLRDDLLGTFGSAAATGKPVGNDLRAGKRTAVLASAEGRLDAAGRSALERVLGRKDASDEAVADAARALEACGARGAVEARLSALCGEAEVLGRSLPVIERARQILCGAASALRWTGA
ncbi:polyprenyl synthetase family protein [Sorangium sp. So ce1036]|uniref:polyprenyl synthetase family protein n=1 Tax=Sorangium sp. So ce1036 TaxID=3133328 RepID=UPI003F0DABB9